MDVGTPCAVNEPGHWWVHRHQHTVTALTCSQSVPEWRHEISLERPRPYATLVVMLQVQHGDVMCPTKCWAGGGQSHSITAEIASCQWLSSLVSLTHLPSLGSKVLAA